MGTLKFELKMRCKSLWIMLQNLSGVFVDFCGVFFLGL